MIMKRINLDYEGDLMAFYDANLEIPEGQAVRCSSVLISERDHNTILEKLRDFYKKKFDAAGQQISESDLKVITHMRMITSGPSTSHALLTGMLQLLDDYLTQQ